MKQDDPFHATFRLYQHTPIIHFQADQPGALIRVSELKPAFDKYIWRHVFTNDFERGKTYMVGYNPKREADLRRQYQQEGELALDYKVSIKVDNTNLLIQPITRSLIRDGQTTTRKESFPGFFGDLGQSESDKRLVLHKSTHYLLAEFSSLHSTLLDHFRHFFPLFLIDKNFGTRQSKGFGSFTVLNAQNQPVIPPGMKYSFTLDLTNEINSKKRRWLQDYQLRYGNSNDEAVIVETECQRLLFRHIELFWRVVRSGFNLPGPNQTTTLYIKPPLFFFLQSQNKQWDKRSIKQYYFTRELRAEQSAHPNSDVLQTFSHLSTRGRPVLYRDLLGLASDVAWGRSDTLKKEHIPRDGEEKIDRFKSPVTFKPIRSGNVFTVYFTFDPNEPLPAEMYDQAFAIKKNNTGDLVMDTPRREEFSLEHFLDYVAGDYADKVKAYKYGVSDNSFITATQAFEPPELKILKTVFGSLTKTKS